MLFPFNNYGKEYSVSLDIKTLTLFCDIMARNCLPSAKMLIGNQKFTLQRQALSVTLRQQQLTLTMNCLSCPSSLPNNKDCGKMLNNI
jgi:hypothetical protein